MQNIHNNWNLLTRITCFVEICSECIHVKTVGTVVYYTHDYYRTVRSIEPHQCTSAMCRAIARVRETNVICSSVRRPQSAPCTFTSNSRYAVRRVIVIHLSHQPVYFTVIHHDLILTSLT